jgi:DNA-binding transcriptional ArsR family regulator
MRFSEGTTFFLFPSPSFLRFRFPSWVSDAARQPDLDVGAQAYRAVMDHGAGWTGRTRMDPFEVMAEPARRRIVEVLASGEHTAGQLAEVISAEFRISRTAVSKHLRILRDAAFVDVFADQSWRWYHLLDDGLTALEEAVAELRHRTRGGVGMPVGGVERDPTYGVGAPRRTVRRKGPGRPLRRGMRGTQTTRYVASDPE